MKIKRTLLLFCLFTWGTFYSSFGQLLEAENSKHPENPERVSQDFFSLAPQTKSNVNQLNNHIFIQQVGAGNAADMEISSEDINLDLQQNGYNNAINLNISAGSVSHNIRQQGYNNGTFDFVVSPFEDVRLNLEQKGENLFFEKYGSNAIGNKLLFKMEGRDHTIIVRNYK